AEAEALADVLGGLAPAHVDLRRRAEGAQPDDLHVEAALVLTRDEPFRRDAVRERLLELAGHVAAAPERLLEHDRPGAGAVVGDRRLALVADGDRDLAGFRVTELGEADDSFRLAADRDERGLGTDHDHLSAYVVADAEAALAFGGL